MKKRKWLRSNRSDPRPPHVISYITLANNHPRRLRSPRTQPPERATARPERRAQCEAPVSTVPAAVIGECPGMLAALRIISRVAATETPVLIQGESGTGKQLLARVLHERSPRGSGPFVAVNCAAIPEHLLESELFGHEEGVFADAPERRVGHFELANGGTVCLNGIARVPLWGQAMILRALEDRQVRPVGSDETIPLDVRAVTGSSEDLQAAVDLGQFREDLYYRLAVIVVRIPPLRERGDDIRMLAEHFTSSFARQGEGGIVAISQETLELLLANPWLDNVRELRNALRSAVLAADGPILMPDHLPAEVRETSLRFARRRGRGRERPRFSRLAEVERRHVRRCMAHTGGNLERAADLLGLDRATLGKKLLEHGLLTGPHTARRGAESAEEATPRHKDVT
jgi:two-component system response regulator HydG